MPALPGGFSPWGLQLLAGWLAFSLSTELLWALHLRELAGWSALPAYWGEMLTGRDAWELAMNGGLARHWTGPWVPVAAAAGMLWFLWAGWRLQAGRIGLPARLGPWCWGLVDALVVGAVPLALLAGLLAWGFGALEGAGPRGLAWIGWVGGALTRLAFFSTLFLQWWLCRLDRAGQAAGFRLGSWRALARHLGRSFIRFWVHPGQWLSLVVGGLVVRTGISCVALALGWRLGGGTIPKVGIFMALQLAAVVANAWLLGWFLRLTALFLRHDAEARADGR